LGSSFDIHGGGEDLLFPHHENERAQSMAANGGDFAKYWVHNGFVTVESEKMSKSLGNFLTIRDALKTYHPESLRLFLLSKHYRSPLDFSKDAVLATHSGLVRVYRTLQRLEEMVGPESQEGAQDDQGRPSDQDSFTCRFVEAMDDDLNTVEAIGALFDKVREINKRMESLDEDARITLRSDRGKLLRAAQVLGLLQRRPEAFLRELAGTALEVDRNLIEGLIQERREARAKKDWAAADQIRSRLKEMGIVLEDGPQGTSWRLDV
jgi:cysteinyl-tRNA synthetase